MSSSVPESMVMPPAVETRFIDVAAAAVVASIFTPPDACVALRVMAVAAALDEERVTGLLLVTSNAVASVVLPIATPSMVPPFMSAVAIVAVPLTDASPVTMSLLAFSSHSMDLLAVAP